MQVPAPTSTIMRGFERKKALQRIRAHIRASAIWCRVIMVSCSSYSFTKGADNCTNLSGILLSVFFFQKYCGEYVI